MRRTEQPNLERRIEKLQRRGNLERDAALAIRPGHMDDWSRIHGITHGMMQIFDVGQSQFDWIEEVGLVESTDPAFVGCIC